MVSVCKRKLPRTSGWTRGDTTEDHRGRALRGGHERVGVRSAPDDCLQGRAASCGAFDVRERAHGIVEEHDSESRNDDVECTVLERVWIAPRAF
jgi:hypothetical protein